MKVFKKGDKVKCLRNCRDNYTAGRIYTIREDGVDHAKTECDDAGSATNGWGGENFEVIASPTMTHWVGSTLGVAEPVCKVQGCDFREMGFLHSVLVCRHCDTRKT